MSFAAPGPVTPDRAARKACEKAGCKITGTGSCSTAANVKVCGPSK